MVRWVALSFVVACLFCVIQAAPQSTEGPTEAPATSQIEAALSEAMASLQKGLQGLMDDPALNKVVQDTQKFFQKTAESIQNEAAKIMPKTE